MAHSIKLLTLFLLVIHQPLGCMHEQKTAPINATPTTPAVELITIPPDIDDLNAPRKKKLSSFSYYCAGISAFLGFAGMIVLSGYIGSVLYPSPPSCFTYINASSTTTVPIYTPHDYATNTSFFNQSSTNITQATMNSTVHQKYTSIINCGDCPQAHQELNCTLSIDHNDLAEWIHNGSFFNCIPNNTLCITQANPSNNSTEQPTILTALLTACPEVDGQSNAAKQHIFKRTPPPNNSLRKLVTQQKRKHHQLQRIYEHRKRKN